MTDVPTSNDESLDRAIEYYDSHVRLGARGAGMAFINDPSLRETLAFLRELKERRAVETTREPEDGGHGELCAFCGESCDIFAGDPGRWPLAFAHPDGTGENQYHHVECVTARLFARPALKTGCSGPDDGAHK